MKSSDDECSLRKILAAQVRKRREKLGWSQEELAEACDLSQVYVSRIEAAKAAASIDTLAKLARGLGVEPAGLLLSSEKNM